MLDNRHIYSMGVFGHDDRFDPISQTAEKTRSVNDRNLGGVWSDRTNSVRKCVGSVGNFDRSPNTDRSIFYLD